ncbi:ATP-binding cassette domain-containing protein [Ectothiorhodospiraceae bacterium BW-2]|nr:ATP-binding cassette domain-containing protein [Ectothiorhodospiraceae bacterium BW-2]
MSAAPLLQIDQLKFGWQPNLPLIDIETLRLDAGERLFLYGSSGSGKTTLLSLLGGVTLPHSGTITLLNTTLTALSRAKRDRVRADHIGFIFQQFNLIPYLSVIENILLPLTFSPLRRQRLQQSPQQEAERLLHELDIAPTLWSRAVVDLSVGQQQRVATARALIGHPELIIADEPTSALDSDRRHAFIELLLQECQQQSTSLIFVSHDATLQNHFHRIVPLAEINRCHS